MDHNNEINPQILFFNGLQPQQPQVPSQLPRIIYLIPKTEFERDYDNVEINNQRHIANSVNSNDFSLIGGSNCNQPPVQSYLHSADYNFASNIDDDRITEVEQLIEVDKQNCLATNFAETTIEQSSSSIESLNLQTHNHHLLYQNTSVIENNVGQGDFDFESKTEEEEEEVFRSINGHDYIYPDLSYLNLNRLDSTIDGEMQFKNSDHIEVVHVFEESVQNQVNDNLVGIQSTKDDNDKNENEIVKTVAIYCIHCWNLLDNKLELNQHLIAQQLLELYGHLPLMIHPRTSECNHEAEMNIVQPLNNRDKFQTNEWTCYSPNCAFETTTAADLHKHWVRCHEKGIFQCGQCARIFLFRQEVYAHYASEHKADIENRLQNAQQINSNGRSRSLTSKVLIHGLDCPECDQQVDSKSALSHHLIDAHGTLPFRCSVRECECRFASNFDLKQHYQSEHTKWSCRGCVFEATNSAKLRYHWTINHEKGRFGCGLCDQEFAFKRDVYKHKCLIHI